MAVEMRPASRLRIGLALASVYFVWGSTYLALAFGLESFPPFLLNGIRLLAAGVLLFLLLRTRGEPLPGRRELWNSARVGVVLLVGGLGLVALAQDRGVGSGVAATAVAVMPVWTALIAGLFGSWPRRREWIGLVVGLAGVLILAQEGDFRSSPAGAALIFLAPMVWAFGSVWKTRLSVPAPLMSAAVQLMAGGATMLLLAPVLDERIPGAVTARAWWALAYLTLMGSIVGFTAFVYLLEHVRPTLATSYAYVNPVVAVALGITVGGELLTGPIFVALPLILIGVALVATSAGRLPGRRTRRVPNPPLPREEAA